MSSPRSYQTGCYNYFDTNVINVLRLVKVKISFLSYISSVIDLDQLPVVVDLRVFVILFSVIKPYFVMVMPHNYINALLVESSLHVTFIKYMKSIKP